MSIAHQQKLLAELRQRGKGVWIVDYVVTGYDDTFRMFAPGELREQVAIFRTTIALMLALKTRRKFIILKETKLETP